VVVKRIEVARNIFGAAKSINSKLEGSNEGDVRLTKRQYVCTTTATIVTAIATKAKISKIILGKAELN
jgi:hypothetical protein